MSCEKIMDIVYEYDGEKMPLLQQIQVDLHTIFCSACAQEIKRLEICREILKEDFFPASPGFENIIMEKIAAETELNRETEKNNAAGSLSLSGWVVAGIIITISLVTVFFGMEFNRIAVGAGISFMLPVGITIGVILTSYCALFISSHLKELSRRFGL